MTDPHPHPSWTAPDTMPSRDHLQPRLPADLGALVRCGHLVAIAPNLYRRAPRTRTPAPITLTVREQLDHHIDRIVRALHAGDAPAARRHHAAARALLTRTPAATTTTDSTSASTPTTGTTDTSTAPTMTTSTTSASGQQPLTGTFNRQDVQPTHQSQSRYGTARPGTPAPAPRPSAGRTDPAVTDQETTPAREPQEAVPHRDRRCAKHPSPTPPLPLAEASPPRDLALVGVRTTAAQTISALPTDCRESAPAVNGSR